MTKIFPYSFLADELENVLQKAAQSSVPLAALPLSQTEKLIGGIKQNRVVTIAGKPSSGKSSIAIYIATCCAQQEQPVLYVSYEMPKSSLAARSISCASNFCYTSNEISSSFPSADEKLMHYLIGYHNEVATSLCFINEQLSVEGINLATQRFRQQFARTPIVIIDYVQIMPDLTGKKGSADQSRIRRAARGLRKIATHNNTCIIALSSLTRSAYNSTKADIGSLGGAAQLEYESDVVAMLLPQDKPTKTPKGTVQKLEFRTFKNRYGAIGSTDLFYYPDYCSFEEG